MNVIDRVKELLAAAEMRVAWSFSAEKQQRHAEWNAANDKLRDLSIPIAQELVASQAALAATDTYGIELLGDLGMREKLMLGAILADNLAALRLDGLAKAMKQETPRS